MRWRCVLEVLDDAVCGLEDVPERRLLRWPQRKPLLLTSNGFPGDPNNPSNRLPGDPQGNPLAPPPAVNFAQIITGTKPKE